MNLKYLLSAYMWRYQTRLEFSFSSIPLHGIEHPYSQKRSHDLIKIYALQTAVNKSLGQKPQAVLRSAVTLT